MTTAHRVDVERTFASFVRSIGGEVVEDIVGPSPAFANADYVFRNDCIVAELKRIVDDKAEDQDLQAKIQAKFDRWMADGTIGPIFGVTVVESKSLPLHCQHELFDLYTPSIKRRLIKANKQIKETRAHFGMEDAKGVVILVNDGSYALEANALLFVLNRVLGKQFSAINSVIYCTINIRAKTPFTPKPSLLWVHATRRHVLEPVSPSWTQSLFDSWCSYLQKVIGEPIEKIDLPSPKDVEKVRYARGT
jgi:hypothetical protein